MTVASSLPFKVAPAHANWGMDLRKAIIPMWASLMAVLKYPAQKSPPKVNFHRRRGGRGIAYDHKNRVAVSVDADLGHVVWVLFHELCHKAVGCHQNHNEVFNKILRRGALHLWPWLDLPPEVPLRGYKTDLLIEPKIRDEMAKNGCSRVLDPLCLWLPEGKSVRNPNLPPSVPGSTAFSGPEEKKDADPSGSPPGPHVRVDKTSNPV